MMGKSAIFNARHGAGSFHRYAAFPFQRFGLYRGVVTEVTRAPVRTGDEIRAPSRRRSQRDTGRPVTARAQSSLSLSMQDQHGWERRLARQRLSRAPVAELRQFPGVTGLHRPIYRRLLQYQKAPFEP